MWGKSALLRGDHGDRDSIDVCYELLRLPQGGMCDWVDQSASDALASIRLNSCGLGYLYQPLLFCPELSEASKLATPRSGAWADATVDVMGSKMRPYDEMMFIPKIE